MKRLIFILIGIILITSLESCYNQGYNRHRMNSRRYSRYMVKKRYSYNRRSNYNRRSMTKKMYQKKVKIRKFGGTYIIKR
ncbi:MAG: hypothetical protein KKA07_18715 [Bacteroidetes bacterium]|nr:hypothetical protein [Bacteroidota bacterium]MBU1721105.1 hypothetical protein [Bacteroidota bacterium]